MKWNSSSKVLQYLHFLSYKGILLGFAHRAVSASSLCDDNLNWFQLLRYFDVTKIKLQNLNIFGMESLLR